MTDVDYEAYSDYWSSRCSACKGTKRLLVHGSWVSCQCQNLASMCRKFSQVQVDPPSLKNLTWDDFTGCIKQDNLGRIETVDTLPVSIYNDAKSQAIKWCFDTDNIQNNREFYLQHSQIHQRYVSGSNLIIAGDQRSGKSLLAVLILREVAKSAMYTGKDYDFRWVPNPELLYAASWGTNKPIDYEELDELADVDFLFIDRFDVPRNNPVSLDKMFYGRKNKRPTIATCNMDFFNGCRDNQLGNALKPHRVKQMLGEYALMFMSDPSTQVILLTKKIIG